MLSLSLDHFGDADDLTARRLALGHIHSARAALVTVVGVYVYADPRPVPTGAFLSALGMLGFNDRAARQAMNRARTAGWLESRRLGRHSVWELSPAGHQMMDEGSARLARLRSGPRQWDGKFVFIVASVPEKGRELRHLLRTRMNWAGFAAITPGVWISPHREAQADAATLLRRLEVDAYSFIGTAGDIGDLNQVVTDAWHLDELAEEYRNFIEEFQLLRPADDSDYFLSLLQLVHRWRRLPFIDPGLPAPLLPTPWIGTRAANLSNSLTQLWNARAFHKWNELVKAAHDPV